jgi:hypothetical protein
MEAVVAYPDIFLEGYKETIKYFSIVRDPAEIRIEHLLITNLEHFFQTSLFRRNCSFQCAGSEVLTKN